MQQKNEDVIQLKPLLFSIAYNMTGSIMDAEDMVQDTFASWFSTDHGHIENPKYYLMKTVANRCINHLKQEQRNRETYVGTWLPEPLVEKKAETDPSKIDYKSQLSIGFLYLLERLSPLERAVLILRESFDVPYPELAGMFDISQDNCRQLLSRAKAKLKLEKSRFNVDKQKHSELLHKFLQACVNGSMEELVLLLKEDVVFYSDGGGKVSAALHPLYGKETVLKFISGILKKTGPVSSIEVASVNGLSGAIVSIDKNNPVPDLLIAIDVDENDKIQNLYFIRNPEKLQHIPKN